MKLNIPIKGNIQRKLTEINLEDNINKLKNEFNRNKFGLLDKYELDKPETIIYDLYHKYNNIRINEGKNSILNAIQKDEVNKLLCEIKTNKTNKKYNNYQANKYSIHKIKNRF